MHRIHYVGVGLAVATILFVTGVWMHGISSTVSISENEYATVNPEDRFETERSRRMQGTLRHGDADRFAAYHTAIRTRSGDEAPAYPFNYRVDELQKAWVKQGILNGSRKRGEGLEWQHRGPGNVAGRARAVVPHPDDPLNTWFVGSAGGGVWKTMDRGETWVELTQNLPNLSTSTMVIPASNPSTIYIGTGEGFGSYTSVYGEGIWKSLNGGESWAQVSGTSDDPSFTNVMRLAIDPNNDQVLIAATSTGFRNNQEERSYLMRTVNGGNTWDIVYESLDRIEQVIAHPDDFDVLYATVNGRGVLKSTDAGVSWVELFDEFEDFENTGRLELAIAPTDSERLYVSAEGGPFPSTLYMSADAGLTWNVVTDQSDEDQDWLLGQGWYNNSIAVDPFDKNVVYVGGVDIMRYDISPNTFEVGLIKDVVEIDPQNIFDVDRVISGPETAERLSRESGLVSSEFMPVEVRWGPEKSQKAHRFTGKWVATYEDYLDVPFEVWNIETGQQLMVLYEDQDQDKKWDITGVLKGASERMLIMAEPYHPVQPHIPTTFNAFERAQYVLNVVTEDTEVEHGPFPLATVRITPSIKTYTEAIVSRVTSGYSLNEVEARGVHVDHHHLVLIPTDEMRQEFLFLDANDGGLAFSTDNAVTFTQTGDTFAQNRGGGSTNKPIPGMNTSQFYGVDKMNGEDRYVGGTQDNGSWVSPADADLASAWSFAPSGDGFEAVWHYTNPDWLIQSSQFNRIQRSTDGGDSWEDVSPGGSSPFLTRLAKTNREPDLLFLADNNGVIRSEDFGSTWSVIDIPDGWPSSSRPTVRISLASPEIVWAGAAMTEAYNLQVSTNRGAAFQATSSYKGATLGPVTDIATHPFDSLTAYALFSFAESPKVLRTTDLGASWEDLSGFEGGTESQNGFPDVATYSLLVMPHDTDILWAGTEIGIFESTDGGATWAYADNGLPAVAVWQMSVVNDEVIVATHGRGVWTATIPELASYEPFLLSLPPALLHAEGRSGSVDLELDLRAEYDSTRVMLGGEWITTLPGNTSKDRQRISIPVPGSGNTEEEVVLIAYQGGSQLQSNIRTVQLYDLDDPVTVYSRSFEEDEHGFLLQGFSVQQPDGFENRALHSPHPYAHFENIKAQSLTPLVVQPERPFFVFDEIVLIEPGKPGASYGQPAFFDYVIVEGSNDAGTTWLPLTAGYDSQRIPLWEANYKQSEAPSSALFVSHELNLLDTFRAGDEVLVRFRLVTDNSISGWGWAIDNVRLESTTATQVHPPEQAFTYQLSVNYPNPFNSRTTIEYSLAHTSRVTLAIYDITGRLVQEPVSGVEQQAGHHRIEWDGRDRSGVPVASGVYMYRLKAGDQFQASRQLVVIR